MSYLEWKKSCWARPGFEPGTSRTLSENHTPRPTSQSGFGYIDKLVIQGPGWESDLDIQNVPRVGLAEERHS